MALPDEPDRDVGIIEFPSWGRVVATGGVVPYEVLDDDGQPIEPIRRYLRDFLAQGRRPGSVRSYAYDLLRWWRRLRAVGVEWDRATSVEVCDLVLWLQRATKRRRTARTTSAVTAGTINPITRKPHPGDRYQPRTIRAVRRRAAQPPRRRRTPFALASEPARRRLAGALGCLRAGARRAELGRR